MIVVVADKDPTDLAAIRGALESPSTEVFSATDGPVVVKLTRQHELALTGLAAAQRTEVDVFAQSDGGVDQLISQLTTATDPSSTVSGRR